MDGIEFRDLEKEAGKKELPIYYAYTYQERERERERKKETRERGNVIIVRHG